MRRQRGERGDPGHTRILILDTIIRYNSISEPDLREIVKPALNLSEDKSIKNQLLILLDKGFVEKNKTLGTNYWSPTKSAIVLKPQIKDLIRMYQDKNSLYNQLFS